MEAAVLLLIGTILNIANGVIVIHSVEVNENKSLANIKVNFFNDNVHDTVLNIVIENFVILNNIWVYMKIDLSQNRNDHFNVNFVNTVFDLGKLFRGAFANPMIKIVTDSLLKNTNFELKFPFRPVSVKKLN